MSEQTLAPSADAIAWPEGVLYRFPTLFGSTVDVTAARTVHTWVVANCRACDADSPAGYRAKVNEWAQEHSAKCRALPRPTT